MVGLEFGENNIKATVRAVVGGLISHTLGPLVPAVDHLSLTLQSARVLVLTMSIPL